MIRSGSRQGDDRGCACLSSGDEQKKSPGGFESREK